MSAKWKILTAVALLIAMVPVAGVVYVKENLDDPGYCANCHEVPHYVTWAAPKTEYTLAHAHNLKGVVCQDCHARTLTESVTEVVDYMTRADLFPLQGTRLPNTACFKCHGSYEAITRKTKDLKRNPHNGHWSQMECGECHRSHRDSSVYCETCHDPMMGGKPGWSPKPVKHATS